MTRKTISPPTAFFIVAIILILIASLFIAMYAAIQTDLATATCQSLGYDYGEWTLADKINCLKVFPIEEEK
jgi:hypothetical protein